mgnify:CR=1 FL=1
MRNLILLIIMVTFFYDTISANASNFATTPLEDNSEETLQLLSASTDKKSAKIFSENCSSCHSGGVPRLRGPRETTHQPHRRAAVAVSSPAPLDGRRKYQECRKASAA